MSYSDSKNVQYLIKGNGIFNLGQSSFNYQDERREVMHYLYTSTYDENYLKVMNNKINALRYKIAEDKNNLESFELIDVKDLKEVYCNDDWYILTYLDNSIDSYNESKDIRAKEEEEHFLNEANKLNKVMLKTKKQAL